MRKKTTTLSLFFMSIILSLNSLLISTSAAESLKEKDWSNTYLGYLKENTLSDTYIKKNGEDKVVYSYNDSYVLPRELITSRFPQGVTPEANNDRFPIYIMHDDYKNLSNYLLYEENNHGVTFDTNVMEGLLFAGYPYDSFGLMEKYNISPGEARATTHALILQLQWFGSLDSYAGDDSYFAALSKAAIKPIVKIVIPEVIGDATFKKVQGSWQTERLIISSEYPRDTIRLKLPEGITLWTEDGKEQLQAPSVGSPFILKASKEPVGITSIALEYSHQVPKTYFYQWIKGTGGSTFENRPYTNLIGTEVEYETSELSIDVGVIPETPEKPAEPGTPENPKEEIPKTYDGFHLEAFLIALGITTLAIIALAYKKKGNI